MPEYLSNDEKVRISASLGESHFREFKSAYHGPVGLKKPRPTKDICKDVAEALVAFANADGGEILIGVEDNGDITGVNNLSADAVSTILESSETHVFGKTPLSSVKKFKTNVDGLTVLHFSIAKSIQFAHLTSDGRCLKRNDLETIPISSEQLVADRDEIKSREFDRNFMDGASVSDLDADLMQIVSEQISRGMSSEKCLQYLGLAEYAGPDVGFRLRRAALLLFAKQIDRWHPRSQVRFLKVNGTKLGAGPDYNVTSDTVIKDNICRIVEKSWDELRPYLVHTTFHQDARFKSTFMYPETACREALVNAIAHRDYSNEGVGIEVYIFSDRIEIKNPGSLLSTININDLIEMKGVHQSRNTYIARCLRELGFMRELGEGMRRIFELMKSSELAPPDIFSENSSFNLRLNHKPIYKQEEIIWLEQYESFELSAEQKSVILLGRTGTLISPQNIIDSVGIVDTENYRKLVHSLQQNSIMISEIPKNRATHIARAKNIGIRDFPRFKILTAQEISARAAKMKPLHANTNRKQPSPSAIPAESSDAESANLGGFKLHISNVRFSATREDVYKAFKGFGEIIRVSVPGRYKQGKGYAFVTFASQMAAEAAIALSGKIVMGDRMLSCQPARVKTLPQTGDDLS